MRCFSCRQEIPADSEYCPRCGKPQGFAKELLERAAAGDQNAVTELYNGTYPQVCATIRSIVRDEDAAMDILQDTYIKGFQNLGMLDRPGSFRPWIRSIARNRAVDWVRKKKPVLFSQMENEEGEMQDFVDDRPDHLPETVIDRQETVRLLQEMLDGLPEDQRACIAMFYYEEMSLKEIAAALRVSENTVKSRLNYAKKKLRGKVEELEKRGTKLYGLAGAPAVLLVLLFRNQEAQAAELLPPNMPARIAEAAQRTFGRSARTAGRETGRQTAETAAREAVKQAAGTPARPDTGAVSGGAVKTAAGTAAAAAKGVGVKVAAVVLAAAVAGGGTYAGLKHHADRAAREEAQLQAELETAQLPEEPPEAVTVPKPQDSPTAPADEPVPTPAAEQETAAASGEPAGEPVPEIPAGAEERMLDAVVAMMYMHPGGRTGDSMQMRTSDTDWFWNAAAVFFVDYGDVQQPASIVPREEVLQFAYALCPDFREEDGLPPIPADAYLASEEEGHYVLGRGDMGEVMHTAVGSRRLPDGSAELDVDVSWPNGDGSAMITEHYTAHLVPNAHVLAASYKPLYYTVTSITPDGAEEETLAGQAYAYLDGLWETWGGKPYSTYYLFSQGTITVYTADIADDGETWTYAESGTTRIERAENMSDGVSEGTAFWLPGGRSFYFSRPGEGDILECRWIEDDGSWGYSGTDSLARITDLTVEELLTTTFGR